MFMNFAKSGHILWEKKCSVNKTITAITVYCSKTVNVLTVLLHIYISDKHVYLFVGIKEF